MTARTHDTAALLAFGALLLAYGHDTLALSTLIIAFVANQLGGIAPDIDQPTAPLWRNLPEGHFVGRAFGRLLGGHRFVSHSLLGLALFGWLSKLLLMFLHPIMPHADSRLIWYAFLVGYISHLVMDTLTKEGVPWLLPIPYKFGLPPLRRFRITTGKAVENFVVLPLLLLVGVWLCRTYYSDFIAILRHVRT